MGIGGASSLVYGLKMNSSPLAKLLLQAESGGGQQVWDNYNHNHNYNYNNHNDNWNYNYGYDHNAAQSRLQLQGWEFSQPTNHNYTTPCAPFYNTNPKNEDDDVVVAQLPNLAFPNLSSATSSSSSSSSSSSASAFSLLYGNHHRAGSCLLDSILGPLVKRSRSDFTSPTTTTFAPVTPTSIATAHSPSCQALGCKADLRLSKHYHRRHKVCEQHSKAASIVINGNPQRFCQQCSRFHSLSEFDDGKRSCRKRLADHNRRRRKPQPINSNANTTNGVVAASNSTSNDSSTNTTSSNTTTTTSTTNTATAMDTTMTMSITFPNNTTSSKSNHKNEHLDQENKEKKGQLEDKIMHMHSSSGSSSSSSSIGSILSLSGGQVDLPSNTWKLHSPNVHSNNNNNSNSNGTFATTIQNHQKHHVEEKHHHHYIVEEEEEDKKDFFSEDYPLFSKSNSNGGKIEGLQSLRIPFHKLIYNDYDHYL